MDLGSNYSPILWVNAEERRNNTHSRNTRFYKKLQQATEWQRLGHLLIAKTVHYIYFSSCTIITKQEKENHIRTSKHKTGNVKWLISSNYHFLVWFSLHWSFKGFWEVNFLLLTALRCHCDNRAQWTSWNTVILSEAIQPKISAELEKVFGSYLPFLNMLL